MTAPRKSESYQDLPLPPLSLPDEEALEALEVNFISQRRQGSAPLASSFVLDHLPIAREAEERLRTAALLLDEVWPRPTEPADPERTLPGTEDASELLTPDLPECIGRFQIVERIGEGAFGTVFWAYDPKYDRDVALKVLRAAAYRRQDAEAFQREARIEARLRHPNVVAFYESGDHDGAHYLAAQLVCGESLEERLARQPRLPAREAAELVRKVAQGLAYAHQHGIVHRDVKPSNILLDEHGEPLLADFGLARCRALDRSISYPGAVMGSVLYMPPEQLEGRSDEADERSDVYSLGVVFYRLLTGRLPIEASSVPEQLARVQRAEYPLLRAVQPDVPRDLETICRKAMAVEPGNRFKDATRLADELWRWLNGEPLTIRPATLWERTRRWIRRHRVKAWALLGAFLMLLVAGGASAYAFHRGQVEAESARAREIVEAQTRAEVEVRALVERARVRLGIPTEGRRRDAQGLLAAAGKPLSLVAPASKHEELLHELRSQYATTLAIPDLAPLDRKDRVAIRQWAFAIWPAAIRPDGKGMALGLPQGPVYWARGKKPELPARIDPTQPRPQLVYSPAGDHLLFVRPDGALQAWDGAVTRFRELEGSTKAAVRAIGFGPAGKTLVVLRSDGRTRSWSLPDFKELPARTVVIDGLGAIRAAAFNEGATRLAVGSDKGRVALLDLLSGEGRALAQLREPIARLAWSPDARLVAVATQLGLVGLWHADGRPSHQLEPLSLGPDGLFFSPDGRWLLAGSRNDGMWVWDTATGQQVLRGGPAPLGASRDGRTLVLGGTEEVVFRDVRFPTALARLTGHRAGVLRVNWSQNNRMFATLDYRSEVRVWERSEAGNLGPRLVRTIQVPHAGFFPANAGFALDTTARWLAYASGGVPSHVRIYEVQSGKEVNRWTLPGGFEILTGTGAGKFLLVREQLTRPKRTVDTVLWELEMGKEARQVRIIRKSQPGDQLTFLSRQLTPNGRFYAWLGPREGGDRRVEIWDLKAGKQLAVLPGGTEGDEAVYLSPNGQRLWVGRQRQWWLHDLEQGGPPVRGPGGPPSAIGRGGDQLMSERGGWLDEYRLVWWRKGHPFLNLPSGAPGFSPDGRSLALGCSSGEVWVADLPELEAEVARFVQALTRE
jgi:WD40 repeat protein